MISQVEIDHTPELDFSLDVLENDLVLKVTNRGWGIARHCLVEIQDDVLSKVFDENTLRGSADIQSGETSAIVSLPANRIAKSVLQKLNSD